MKYYIFRFNKTTTRMEVKLYKTLDNWGSVAYLKAHPDHVWQFSKQGAKKIVARLEARWDSKSYEYSIVSVDEFKKAYEEV